MNECRQYFVKIKYWRKENSIRDFISDYKFTQTVLYCQLNWIEPKKSDSKEYRYIFLFKNYILYLTEIAKNASKSDFQIRSDYL